MISVVRTTLVAKTHLDLGFTDLAANVFALYLEKFIPDAIALAQRLETEGGKPRYAWMVGSWLMWQALEQADLTRRRQAEQAVLAGHLHWHAMPCTTHTAAADASLMRYGLGLSQRLDQRFGRIFSP